MEFQKLVFASDHAGVALKNVLMSLAISLGLESIDLGVTNIEKSVDYPDYAIKAVEEIYNEKADAAILICGSGIGMSIVANRFSYIRAALCRTPEEVALARSHNDANVLCLGARTLGLEEAKSCLKTFLRTPFEGGRHALRLNKIP